MSWFLRLPGPPGGRGGHWKRLGGTRRALASGRAERDDALGETGTDLLNTFLKDVTHASHDGVGAGPCGLWCATQLKLRLPGASVHVYEKRGAYVRRQQLRPAARVAGLQQRARALVGAAVVGARHGEPGVGQRQLREQPQKRVSKRPAYLPHSRA